jgi:hypothetical protein
MTLNGREVEVVEERLITTWDAKGVQFQYVAVVVRPVPAVEVK